MIDMLEDVFIDTDFSSSSSVAYSSPQVISSCSFPEKSSAENFTIYLRINIFAFLVFFLFGRIFLSRVFVLLEGITSGPSIIIIIIETKIIV